MKAWNKFLPVFEGEGGSGGGAPPAAAPAPPSAPTPSSDGPTPPPASSEVRELEGEEMKFVSNAFDLMTSDLNEEELTELPGQAPVEEGTQGVLPPVQTQVVPLAGVASPTPPLQPQITPGAAQPSAAPPTAPQPTPQSGVPEVGAEPSKILDQIAEQVAQQQEVFTKALADTQYKIDEKEAEALGFLPDQAKSIAALQAKVHVNVISSMTQMLSKQLPVMVQGLLTARDKSREAEDRFYGAWPQLRGQEKQGTLIQVMKTYRQMNPQAKEEDFIKTTGAMACAILGIPLQQAGTPAVQPQQVRTPGPVVRQTNGLPAFAPAGTSTAPPSAHPSPQLNEWDRLARIIGADDQGAFDR